MKCNTDCRKLEEGTEERASCEEEFCSNFEPPKDAKEKEDLYSYDYDYADEYEDANNKTDSPLDTSENEIIEPRELS